MTGHQTTDNYYSTNIEQYLILPDMSVTKVRNYTVFYKLLLKQLNLLCLLSTAPLVQLLSQIHETEVLLTVLLFFDLRVQADADTVP